ncbi:MAG: hypothetical protein K2Q01_10995, partial [Rickettsiales bacterium]|nr:hypothetical protein [Rickettsiales bacterium]
QALDSLNLEVAHYDVLANVFRDREKSKAYTGKDDPHGGKAVVEKFVVDNVNHMAKSLPGGDWFLKNQTAQRYLGLAALDTAFTKITAVIMKATNGAKKAQMPGEVGDDDARSADPNSVNQIKFVDKEYEDLRKEQPPQSPAPTEKPTHVDRVLAEKKDRPNPIEAAKQNVKKAESFAKRIQTGDCAPPSVTV